MAVACSHAQYHTVTGEYVCYCPCNYCAIMTFYRVLGAGGEGGKHMLCYSLVNQLLRPSWRNCHNPRGLPSPILPLLPPSFPPPLPPPFFYSSFLSSPVCLIICRKERGIVKRLVTNFVFNGCVCACVCVCEHLLQQYSTCILCLSLFRLTYSVCLPLISFALMEAVQVSDLQQEFG